MASLPSAGFESQSQWWEDFRIRASSVFFKQDHSVRLWVLSKYNWLYVFLASSRYPKGV